MNGDPVEESGQAVRQGFLQALQTAHTTNALFGRRGGESRSRAESEQRLSIEAAKNQRSWIEHQARLGNLGAEQALSVTKIEEVRARITNSATVADIDARHKEGQIERADKDLARREKDGALAREQSRELHKQKIDGYLNRETRSVELHALDVKLKELMIEIRRRAAGFTDTLHRTDERTGPAKSAAAQFAAADATRNLSPEAQADAAAYDERFLDDTGLHPQDFFADDGADLADSWSQGLGEVSELAEELTIAARMHHEFGWGIDDLDRQSEQEDAIVDAEVIGDGAPIEAAVTATAVHNADPRLPDADLVDTATAAADAPGKEIELWRGLGPDAGSGR
ncbi:hypothetical protein [Nocardia salmonicida]|uniref:hypothetical protein n=1 Tax=Nocardia salmonicida TaxID=53431 RepID=UPI00340A92E5